MVDRVNNAGAVVLYGHEDYVFSICFSHLPLLCSWSDLQQLKTSSEKNLDTVQR